MNNMTCVHRCYGQRPKFPRAPELRLVTSRRWIGRESFGFDEAPALLVSHLTCNSKARMALASHDPVSKIAQIGDNDWATLPTIANRLLTRAGTPLLSALSTLSLVMHFGPGYVVGDVETT